MEPLLPGEHRLGPLLERAHDLIRQSERLAGWSPEGALPGLRRLLRAMNAYASNKIEGQHTLPLEIEQALRNDYARDADRARRQRLALAHMATEAQLEQRWAQWTTAQVWAPSLRALHYLFAAQAELARADFKALLGLGERLATAQVSALLRRGLLETDSPHGTRRLGVPQHALRFCFPHLWPEAEAQA